MTSISSIKQNLYVNSDSKAPGQQKPIEKLANQSDAGEQGDSKKSVLKVGSEKAMADAEAIFSQANSFSQISVQAQKSLQAYEALDLSMKREAVSELMGVDIYA
jgi:hypothetical protein